MKDEKTSKKMLLNKQELLNKYDDGHFPLEDIEFMKTEIHYAWSNNFDFLPPILENCVQNINLDNYIKDIITMNYFCYQYKIKI